MGDFLQFDSDKANIMDDANYALSTYRTGGCVSGVAPSNIHNKLFYQLSTFVAAFSQMMAGKGYTMDDNILADLAGELENVVTKEDFANSFPISEYHGRIYIPCSPYPLILQWGGLPATGVNANNVPTDITYPVTFPHLSMIGLICYAGAAPVGGSLGTYMQSNSQLRIYNSYSAGVAIRWLVIGY